MSVNRSLQATFLADENGNTVGVVLDGSVYRLQSVGKILNSSGTQINPATQETLSSIDGKDFATQTTLSSVLTKLTEIDTALDAVKDTDGVKKITDPLPAGTNNIGDVDVASSVLPAGAATETTLQAVSSRIGEVSSTPTINTVQDRLKEVEATLTSLDAKDYATQTTLALVLSKLTEIDSVLDSIKDTDGIKKITDALPTGTNIIGKALVTDIDGDMAVKDGDGHPEMHITGDSLSFSLEMIRRELAQIRMLTEYSLDASFREAEDDD